LKKVVVIGAGPAGLTAGYELLRNTKEYEVIILEELNEVGGISKTIKYNGNRMDIGGHRFFSKDEQVMNFWKELMPIQKENPADDERVMLIRNRVSRIYYLNKFFDYPISLKLQTFINMGFINTVKAGASYLKSIIIKKDETSLENFYINRFGKTLYNMFFEKYTEKLWGRHPSNISADWGAQRVKGISITVVIKDAFFKLFKKRSKKVETSLIEQFWYPKYGPGELWETLADEIQNLGGVIKKGYLVKNINIHKNKITNIECIVNGEKELIEGDIFISSMPIKDLVEGFKNTDIPNNIKEIASGLPYRDFQTVGLLVKKMNLKNKTKIKTLGNIIPDCWIYVQEPDVKLGRIQIFNNWSPYLVKDVENTIWLGLEYFCNENDEYWNMSDEEFIKFATEELIKMKIIESEDVLDAHREKVKKAYPAYFDTYKDINKLIDYLNNFENLYCIGRNGQHRYNNMDHSMVTAFQTVQNIINNKKSKENIWNVNTEKEYHEEKV